MQTLVEIVAEFLEDGTFGRAVSLKVIAVFELFDSFFFFATEGLGYENTDIYDQVSNTFTISFYSW